MLLTVLKPLIEKYIGSAFQECLPLAPLLINGTVFFGYSLFFGNNKIIKLSIVSGVIVLFSGFLLEYIIEVILRKNESLGTRADQYNVLIGALTSDVSNFIFGNGLGGTLSVSTSFRDYTGDIYFELQGLYYIYQFCWLLY